MATPEAISDPRPQRALHRTHRALEEELRGLLRTDRADAILEKALETVLDGSHEDPARQLRSIVGARLLDEVADLLSRVSDVIELENAPTIALPLDPMPEPIRLDQTIDERRGRSRIQRHWSPGTAVARRIVG